MRPHLEYCCSVWDPHLNKHTNMLEAIQRRAARVVLRRYHNTSSVTNMLEQLNWVKLSQRRARIRLTLFYKMQTGLVALPLPTIVRRPLRVRPGFHNAFQTLYCSTDSLQIQFFPLELSHSGTYSHMHLHQHPPLNSSREGWQSTTFNPTHTHTHTHAHTCGHVDPGTYCERALPTPAPDTNTNTSLLAASF